MDPSSPLFRFTAAPALELVLRRPDGGRWVLTLSPGMERFIGAYPRLAGIDSGGPLLVFRAVDFTA